MEWVELSPEMTAARRPWHDPNIFFKLLFSSFSIVFSSFSIMFSYFSSSLWKNNGLHLDKLFFIRSNYIEWKFHFWLIFENLRTVVFAVYVLLGDNFKL